jgi:hypothetical protein
MAWSIYMLLTFTDGITRIGSSEHCVWPYAIMRKGLSSTHVLFEFEDCT